MALGLFKKLAASVVGRNSSAPTGEPFSFCGQSYLDASSLGAPLLAQQTEALRVLQNGTLARWVSDALRNKSLGSLLKEIAADPALTDAAKLAVLGLVMDPTSPPQWENEPLSAEWVSQNREKAMALIKSGYPFWLKRLRQLDWFSALMPTESKLDIAGRECTFVAVPSTGVQMCTTVVTRGQWKEFVRQSGWNKSREWENPGFEQTEDHPVVNITWEEANDFCAWISKLKGREFRMATDDEWSKAAGGTTYPYGNHHPPTEKDGIYSFPYDRTGTAPVATCRPNRLGIYDLGGNVWEWSKEGPTPDSPFRVLRGASWFLRQKGYLTCGRRPYASLDDRDESYGFRLVVVVLSE
jgi:formylglycine-generating enzyme required for sulfatase activity